DPKTGQIKFNVSIADHKEGLYDYYKKEIFKYHYPREDGRLLILLDQGKTYLPRPQLIVPQPISRKPVTRIPVTHKTKLPEIASETQISAEPGVIQSDPSSLSIEQTQISESINDVSIDATRPIIKGRKKKERLTLTPREQMVLKLVESKPNKKVQSKGLRKQVNLDQEGIRNILRSLVAKNYLYVRAAWYIVKEEPDEDLSDFTSEIPLEDRLKRLTPKERKIFDILDKRSGRKAQARMLVKETKMTRENLKKLLRNMVTKDVLYVYAAWYVIKD
ncbi:MAG: hypothetical protein ACXAC7_00810, partial [Candidatus Hodarchaeales archaeon]